MGNFILKSFKLDKKPQRHVCVREFVSENFDEIHYVMEIVFPFDKWHKQPNGSIELATMGSKCLTTETNQIFRKLIPLWLWPYLLAAFPFWKCVKMGFFVFCFLSQNFVDISSPKTSFNRIKHQQNCSN